METLWIEFELAAQTDRALCVREAGMVSTWVPKSQVQDFQPDGPKERLEDFERGDTLKIELPAWLVQREELDDMVVDP